MDCQGSRQVVRVDEMGWLMDGRWGIVRVVRVSYRGVNGEMQQWMEGVDPLTVGGVFSIIIDVSAEADDDSYCRHAMLCEDVVRYYI